MQLYSAVHNSSQRGLPTSLRVIVRSESVTLSKYECE